MHQDSGRERTLQIMAAMAGVAVFGLSFGLLYPLMALNLSGRGYSASYIGLIAAMQPLGLVCCNVLLPSLVKRTGVSAVLKISIIANALVFAAYPLVTSLPMWFMLRFIHGALAAAIYVVSESIVIRLSAGDGSPRLMSIYTAVMQSTFGSGPLILLLTGVDGAGGFLTGAALTVVGGVIMLAGGATKVNLAHEGTGQPMLTVIWRLRFLLAGYAVFAFTDAAVADLLPIYGTMLTLTTAKAALLLSAFLFGSTLLQIPLSQLFARVSDGAQLPLNVAAVALSFLGVALAWDSLLIWPAVALAGALTSSVSTVSLTQLGKNLSGGDLISGTASINTAWGIICLIATPIVGFAMDQAGPVALPTTIAAFALLSFAIMLLALRRGPLIRGHN